MLTRGGVLSSMVGKNLNSYFPHALPFSLVHAVRADLEFSPAELEAAAGSARIRTVPTRGGVSSSMVGKKINS